MKTIKSYSSRFSILCLAWILGSAPGWQPSLANEVVTSWTGGATGIFLGMTNETFGYEFTVGPQDINVTSLGIWVSPLTGELNYSHEVGLWEPTGPSTGTLLASVTIGSGLPPSLSPAGFWYEPILPMDLLANTTYVLGAKYPWFAADIDWGTRSAVATAGAGVTLGDARLSYTMTFDFPVAVNGSMNNGYFGPNMEYTIVPEPSSSALFGLGLAGLAWLRSRRGQAPTRGRLD
jgi:hypothetical protein